MHNFVRTKSISILPLVTRLVETTASSSLRGEEVSGAVDSDGESSLSWCGGLPPSPLQSVHTQHIHSHKTSKTYAFYGKIAQICWEPTVISK